jgi:hypothetical protein
LIEVVQTHVQNINTGSTNLIQLPFNHPTKFISWVIRPPVNESIDKFTGLVNIDIYNNNNIQFIMKNASLILNGNERFRARNFNYFNQVQPFQHFSGYPQHGIYVYSFAEKPEEHQPSGSINFSRIDNAQLQLECNMPNALASEVTINAFSYNVLRIASGMGGLAFSN